MRNFIFICYFIFLIPIISYSQLKITTTFIERTETDKRITNILDFSISSFINDDLLIGLTNEEAIADHISYGYNPVKDSLNVSNFQLFLKYYLQENTFFSIKIPTKSDIAGMSTFDRIRVGGGYIFHSENNLDFDVSYDLLLQPNANGWRKGKITIGVSKIIDINMLKASVNSRLFHKFTQWLNTPPENGYRESMYYSKLNSTSE